MTLAAETLDPLDALPEALRPLARRGQPRRYGKNMRLIEEGDRGDTLFIVLSGCVRAFSTDEQGREITYGHYGTGEYLGEMSLDGGPRSASVETLEPTVCIEVTRQSLRDHFASNPEFAFELLYRVIGRARIATENARNLAFLDVYGRLAKVLTKLAGPDGQVGDRPTHQELASHAGSSREMVSRLLKDLERGGYVEVVGRRLFIRRPLPAHW